MPTSTPGQYTTFIPDHAASQNLVVDFSRDPKSFALPEWSLYVPAKKTEGRYVLMTVEMAGRILNTDLADFYWPDEGEAPTGYGNLETFSWESFVTRRYAFPFRMGELAAEQASWDVLASHARYSAQRAMTARTQAAVTVATTSGNYAASHTSAVSSITGVSGKWDISTTARKDIKRSLDHAAEVIFKDTLGAVKPEDLIVVMSPGCAKKIALSQEIVDMVKAGPSAEKEITKTLSRANRFGLPESLYGYKTVIEDAVKVTSRKGATKATSYVLGDSTPFMCSRPGGLEGVEGAPSFSTFHVFLKEEMTVESKHDRDNRRHLGRVVDDYAVKIAAPISGFLFTAAVD
jgi:hypothetical protein